MKVQVDAGWRRTVIQDSPMMPLTGFYLIGVGLMIDFVAGLVLVLNMGLGVFSIFRSATTPMPSIDDPKVRGQLRVTDVGKKFLKLGGGHLAAMGALALGGFVFAIGILVAVVQAIQTYG